MTITQETLTWVFKEPDWKNKFIVGSALMLAASAVPIIGWLAIFAIVGYQLIIMRAVLRGESPMLPKWENFGALFRDGLKGAVATMAYFIPGILGFCCAYGALFGIIFSGVLGSAGSRRAPDPSFGIAFIVGELAFFVLIALGITCLFIGMILSPIANAQYARTGEIGAGYRLRQVWMILRQNWVGYLLAWTVLFGLSMILNYAIFALYATVILCILMPVVLAPVTFYLSLIGANLFGTAYREAIAKIPELQSARE